MLHEKSVRQTKLLQKTQNLPTLEEKQEVKFVLDVHLARLARFLRILGFDAAWSQNYSDLTLLELIRSTKRTLLTRDRALFESAESQGGYYVQATKPLLQLNEVLEHFSLWTVVFSEERFLTRCLECNVPILSVPPSQVESHVPVEIFRKHCEFFLCPTCKRVFWKGSHYDRMRDWLHSLREIHPSGR